MSQQGFTQWVRINLSPNHIYSAFHQARLSQELENSGNKGDRIAREQHRAFVIGAVLASVAFLEAAINELFYASSDSELGHDGLDADFKQRLSALWMVETFRRGARLLEKYQVALQLAGRTPFQKGTSPYQEAKLLVNLRNALVHFVPTTVPIKGKPGVEIPLDEFGKQLQGKFPENPWKAKHPLVSTGLHSEKATWPFFPEGCLGSGCAFWGAQTALAFADKFFNILKLRWYYEHLRSDLMPENSTG